MKSENKLSRQWTNLKLDIGDSIAEVEEECENKDTEK